MENFLITAHERRIARLEEGFGSISQTVTKIEADMNTNNRMTSTLVADTKDIQEMVAGLKTLGKIMAWGVGFTGGVLGILVALYALEWIPK